MGWIPTPLSTLRAKPRLLEDDNKYFERHRVKRVKKGTTESGAPLYIYRELRRILASLFEIQNNLVHVNRLNTSKMFIESK